MAVAPTSRRCFSENPEIVDDDEEFA